MLLNGQSLRFDNNDAIVKKIFFLKSCLFYFGFQNLVLWILNLYNKYNQH